MAWAHQLKMLLWKNFFLKKRRPFIIAIEIIVPVVFFILLAFVRHLMPMDPTDSNIYGANALPSAGLLTLVQSLLCGPHLADGDGFPKLDGNSSARFQEMLTNIDDIYRTYLEHHQTLDPKTIGKLAKMTNFISGPSKCNDAGSASNGSGTNSSGQHLEEIYSTLCGSGFSRKNRESNETSAQPIFELSSSIEIYLMFWQKFLSGQLKVLYSPANSKPVVDVVKRVNRTFEFLDSVTQLAEKWLDQPLVGNVDEIASISNAACWWLKLMSSASFSVFEPFEYEYQAVNYAINEAESDNVTVFAVIAFQVNEGDTKLPPNVKYKIRMNGTYLYSVKQMRPKFWHPYPRNFDLYYYSSGFMFIQDVFDRAIIDSLVGHDVIEPGSFMRHFPSPCYIYDVFLFTNMMIVPFCMTVSYVYSASILVQCIVFEKEKGLKEFMRVMGVGNATHSLAWFITSLIHLTISMSLVVLILKLSTVFAHSNPLIIWMILEIHAITTICYAFLIGSLFSKAKIATGTAGILYFLFYVPSLTLGIHEDIMDHPVDFSLKIIICFLSTSSFGIGCKYIGVWESMAIGVQWNNLATSPIENDNFTLAHCVGMLIVDAVVYSVLALYIENIHPGEYGIAKPWYYPLTKTFWTSSSSSDQGDYELPKFFKRLHDWVTFKFLQNQRIPTESSDDTRCLETSEQDPVGLPIGVEIDRLTKIYDNGKVAVNNLKLNLYESQITALLGHNGAGKSSTMSILSGGQSPSSGTIRIYGRNLMTIGKVRSILGYCPQHNVLFDKLTPEEHIYFYGSLKKGAIGTDEININSILEDVGLNSKSSKLVCHLSGGMKRKLSIALAFLGQPKFVILDEPTAGVDPFSRRQIWQLILKYKASRTILMSTHHMDEAEALSDRIAIISKGSLKCCGSSLFLRANYCEGYHLVFTKMTNKFDSMEFSKFIAKQLESTRLHSETDQELHYVVPYSEERTGRLSNFLERFNAVGSSQGISSVGLFDSTMEEAFLSIDKQSRSASISDESETFYLNRQDAFNIREPDSRGFFIHWKHFLALLTKRVHHIRRGWKVLLFQIILPAIFIATAMSTSLSASLSGDVPALKLTPQQYNSISKPEGIYTATANYALRPDWTVTKVNDSSGWSDAGPSQLSETLHLICGLSADCLVRSPSLSVQGNFTTQAMLEYFIPGCDRYFTEGIAISGYQCPSLSDDPYFPWCSCRLDKSGLSCPEGTVDKAPTHQMITSDRLSEIGAQNLSEYLLYSNEYYKRHRYGAMQFGNELKHIPVNFGQGETSQIRRLATRRVAMSYFDNRGYHAMPIYQNVMNNAILRANIEQRPEELGSSTAYGITTYSHPLNGTDNAMINQNLAIQTSNLVIAVFVVIAMSFIPASFVVFLVVEKSLLIKHLQVMAGVHSITYWVSNFVWDIINYLLPAGSCILILWLFNIPCYVAGDNLSAIAGLLMLYGWSMTPAMYPMSFVQSEPSNAYILLIVINLFVGTTCLFLTAMLDIFSQPENLNIAEANDFIKQAFLPFPSFCLGRGIMDVALNYYNNQIHLLKGEGDKVISPISIEVTIPKYISMAVVGFVMFIFTIVLEIGSRRKLSVNCKSKSISTSLSLEMNSLKGGDDDVVAERNRVLMGGASNDLLILDRLSKRYPGQLAVDELTFGMTQGECFGLLGLNGAGKSTTFYMLSGLNNATSGEARLQGHLLCSRQIPSSKILSRIGFCPQADPLIEELSGREHISFFAKLYNVPSSQTKLVVDHILVRMGLLSFADKPTRTYSGGMKRKLSAALTLIGSPDLILLDEPSSGMDPGSKRFLWNAITELRQDKRLILLTSHSMEECEALCCRLAIMRMGRLMCLGSPQHLKERFGKGYRISLLFPSHESISEASIFRHFSDADFPVETLRVTQQQYKSLELAIFESKPDLSKYFRFLGSLREQNIIADFSISQNTLDNVFLSLASNDPQDEAA